MKAYKSYSFDMGTFTDQLDGEVYRLKMMHDPLENQVELYTYKEFEDCKIDNLEIVLIPMHKIKNVVEALQSIYNWSL